MFQIEQLSIIVITGVLCVLIYWLGRSVKKLTLEKTPSGIALLSVLYVKTFIDFTVDNMGKKHGYKMSAYIGSAFLYILVSNISGLFGLEAPTSNYSVTLALALITWVLIQGTKIRENGVAGYLKGFFKPFFLFVIPNVFSTIAPLISLSLRMFGNVLSGAFIMSLLYSVTGWLSGFVPVIGGINFIAVVITPWLHLYFDLFSGFLQAFLFISLTTIFIAIEYND